MNDANTMAAAKKKVANRTAWTLEVAGVACRCLRRVDAPGFEVQFRSKRSWLKAKAFFGTASEALKGTAVTFAKKLQEVGL